MRKVGFRAVVRWSGVAAGTIGIGALGYDLIGPTYMWERLGPNGASGTSSYLQIGIGSQAVALMAVGAVISILLAGVGWAFPRTGSARLLATMLALEVGLIAVVLGEGGSLARA